MANRRKQRSTMIESIVVMLVICFFMFALIQIVHLFVVQMVTDYTAFSVARSRTVGFNDRLLNRSGVVAAIPASGELISPSVVSYAGAGFINQFGSEHLMIPEYISGRRWWIEYEHSDKLKLRHTTSGDQTHVEVRFEEYPINIPFLKLFYDRESVDIQAEAKLIDYASFYLQ